MPGEARRSHARFSAETIRRSFTIGEAGKLQRHGELYGPLGRRQAAAARNFWPCHENSGVATNYQLKVCQSPSKGTPLLGARALTVDGESPARDNPTRIIHNATEPMNSPHDAENTPDEPRDTPASPGSEKSAPAGEKLSSAQ